MQSVHDAWCKAEVERLLSYFTDDCTYWCNSGSLDGLPVIIEGKPRFRTFLMSLSTVAESASVIENFQFEDGVAHIQAEAYIRHRRTGLVVSTTYRQVVTYHGRKIERCEEYHDTAKMAAFWRMVTCDQTPAAENLRTIEGSKAIEPSK